MDLTDLFTGGLPIVLILSTVLTALVSAFLLWLYRRAVLRAMNIQTGFHEEPLKPFETPITGRIDKPSVLTIIDAASQPRTASAVASIYRQAKRSLNRAAIIYTIGGLFYALILTSAWMITAKGGFVLTRFFWLFSCYSWPVIVAVSLMHPIINKRIAIIYGAIVLIVAIITLARNPESTIGQLAFFWFFANGSGTLLLLMFMNRRVRAVGPLVLAFMFTAVTGATAIVNIVGSSEGLMRVVANIGSALGLGARAIVILLIVIGFGLFGLLGWQLLRWFGRRYQEKKMSDQSITLDAMFLLFGIAQSITLVFEGWAWIFTGLVAFIVYKVTVLLGFMFFSHKDREIVEGQRLLLLRVFSLGRQSERLFDRISNVWLRNGSICLIAGPDLVTSTVEPHEFLNFIGGRLSRQFVSGDKDLEQRLLNMDTRPDPDGRHRVNEFFCRADTWQVTMQRLAHGNDAVLMDLRSFSKINQGCIFELQQLFNYVSLERIIFIVDDSTDRIFLEETIQKIHQQLNPASPNLQNKDGMVRLFTLKKRGFKEIKKLLVLLFGLQPEGQTFRPGAYDRFVGFDRSKYDE